MVTRTGFVGVNRIGTRCVGDLPDPELAWCGWRPCPSGFCSPGPYAYTITVGRGVELAVFVYLDRERGGIGAFGVEVAHVDAEAHARGRRTRQEFLNRDPAGDVAVEDGYVQWQHQERKRWLSQDCAPSTAWRRWWRP